MKEKILDIVATMTIIAFILLITYAAVFMFNLGTSYAATEKGTYQMVKINEFDIEKISDDSVVKLISSESSYPKYQYLRHTNNSSKIGRLPADRTAIHEEFVDYRVEVYQKKPNLWSDAYFEWVRDAEMYNYEDVEYELYVPLKMVTRTE